MSARETAERRQKDRRHRMLFEAMSLLLVSLAVGAACSGSKGKTVQAKDADIGAMDGLVVVDAVNPTSDAILGLDTEAAKADVGGWPDTAADAVPSADGGSQVAEVGTSNPDGAPGSDARDAGEPRDSGDGEVAPPICTTFSDPCAAFVGASFRASSWGTLRFGKQKWVWKFSDAGESGNYTCTNGRVEATSQGGTKHSGEIVGPDCNAMKWDSYGTFQLNGARDPNGPEPQP